MIQQEQEEEATRSTSLLVTDFCSTIVHQHQHQHASNMLHTIKEQLYILTLTPAYIDRDRDAFFKHDYPLLAGALLLCEWKEETDTDRELTDFFFLDECISCVSSVEAMHTAVSDTTVQIETVQRVQRILHAFIKAKERVINLIQETHPPTSSNLSPRHSSCLSCLCSLSSLCLNHLHLSCPPWLLPVNYYSLLAQQAVNTVSTSSSPLLPVVSVAALLSKLCRLGAASQVASACVVNLSLEIQQTQQHHVSTSNSSLIAVLSALNLTVVESVVEHLLLSISVLLPPEQHTAAMTLMFTHTIKEAMRQTSDAHDSQSPQSSFSALVLYLLTNKFLLIKPLSVRCCHMILNLLFSLSYPSASPSSSTDAASWCHPVCRVFDDTLISLCRLWSTDSFLHKSSLSTQSYIQAAILFSLSLLQQQQQTQLQQTSALYRRRCTEAAVKTSDDHIHSVDNEDVLLTPFASHPALYCLMSGVQLRLGEVRADHRESGMLMATEISRTIDPTRLLIFPHSEASDTQQPTPHIVSEKTEDKQSITPEGQSVVLDADSLWTGGETLNLWSSASVSSSSPSLSFPVSSLSDSTADLAKVPAPHYLADVMELLSKQDQREPVEAALRQAETLILSSPVDLPDLALDLCIALQQVSTTVYCEDPRLDDLRRRALIALLIQCPLIIIKQLAHSLYSQSLTLPGKLEVIQIIKQATEQLSGNSQQQQTQTQRHRKQQGPTSPISSSLSLSASRPLSLIDHERIIAERVKRTTRRWGRKQTQTQTTHTANINRLADIASHFFQPLINGIVDRTSILSPSSFIVNEPLLLSELLDCLSLIVCRSCSVVSSYAVSSMCDQCLCVLFQLRVHSSPAIRRACLLSLLRLLLFVPVWILQQSASQLLEMREWIITVEMKNASISQDQQLSSLCLVALQELNNKLTEMGGTGSVLCSAADDMRLLLPGKEQDRNAMPIAVISNPGKHHMIKFM